MRTFVAAAVVVLTLAAAAAVRPVPHPLLVWPAAVALVMLGAAAAGWLRAPFWPVAVAAVSLVTTATWALTSPWTPGGGPWPLLHTAVLMVFAVLACRSAPARWAVATGVLVILAESALAFPVTAVSPRTWWEPIMLAGFWSLTGVVAVAAGVYLRWLDSRRDAAIRDARHAQRVRLASDLHDFVAHDVSAMVVQAQAARVLLRTDAKSAGEALDRIEADGSRALASMDRTIRMLRELDATGPPATATPGIDDLPELVARFQRAARGPVTVDIPVGLAEKAGRETSTAAYRVVVEALTNVRRHARADASVSVSISLEQNDIVVEVHNSSTLPGRRDGTGLVALRERVEALGGEFSAGAHGDSWRVRAAMPAEPG
ncbi:sensor histidine kinase [Fodinicola acaciae]|uniref:sensor histidine kinase n=1 Tax=Fodinicola acaciae TaxID=2681555 RepID=UPI0013D73723|nr:histidine kinase [Fodinicola acaciae]